jgi:hypothetical protein
MSARDEGVPERSFRRRFDRLAERETLEPAAREEVGADAPFELAEDVGVGRAWQ